LIRRDRIRQTDLSWPQKIGASTKSIHNTLLSLAERTHANRQISYEAYLERMIMLRMIAEEMELNIPDNILAIRNPRRGNLGEK